MQPGGPVSESQFTLSRLFCRLPAYQSHTGVNLRPPFQQVLDASPTKPVPGQVYNVLYAQCQERDCATFDSERQTARVRLQRTAVPLRRVISDPAGNEQWKPQAIALRSTFCTTKYYPGKPDGGRRISCSASPPGSWTLVPGPSAIFAQDPVRSSERSPGRLTGSSRYGQGAQLGPRSAKLGMPDTAIKEFVVGEDASVEPHL